jgi:hypothetical protein
MDNNGDSFGRRDPRRDHGLGGEHPLDGPRQARQGAGWPDTIELGARGHVAELPRRGSPLRVILIVAAAVVAVPVIVAVVALFAV